MKKVMKQSKLTFLINFISIAIIMLVIITGTGVIVLTRKTISATDNQISITSNATRFVNGSANLTNLVRAYAATGKIEYFDAYWDEVNTLKNREIAVENMKATGITSEEQSKIDSAALISNELIPIETKAMDLAKIGQHSESLNLVYGDEYNKNIAKIRTLQQELLSMLDVRSTSRIANLRYQTTALWIIGILLIFFVIGCQIISYLTIRKKVIKPIIEVEKEMLEISQGNLSSHFALEPDTSEIGMLINGIMQTKTTLQTYIGDLSEKLGKMSNNNLNILIDVDYIGDFEPIKTALTKIVTSLNATMLHINHVALEVFAGSEQVSYGSRALSKGVTEQASTVENLATTIGEISQQIKVNTKNAIDASHISGKSTEKLLNGNREMENMLLAMAEIDNSSKKINHIIKTVSDIAFQTNILALNAAVEAARAGSAGKGFAVVADEVRNLANKSTDAVKHTKALIENSTKAVENGIRLSNSTAEILQEVMIGAKTSTGLLDEIAKASERQAESVQHILQGVEQISEVVQTNSATAEESAASSEELSKQAQMLKDLVGVFNLSQQIDQINF